MRRLRLVFACTLGSGVGAVVGVAAGVALNSAWWAWLAAAVFPGLALWLAGFHQRRQLAKIMCYALLGWGLCFVLEPATSQSSTGRARRIAEDTFRGKGWYVPCHVAGWVLASVGVAFAPLGQTRGETNEPGEDRTDLG
jgi:hypothetical protein